MPLRSERLGGDLAADDVLYLAHLEEELSFFLIGREIDNTHGPIVYRLDNHASKKMEKSQIFPFFQKLTNF